MSKKVSTERTYAVELFVKMVGYKGKTFKGLTFSGTKDDACVLSVERLCESLVSQNYPCRHVDIKVKSCVEYSDFRFSDRSAATGIMEAKDE